MLARCKPYPWRVPAVTKTTTVIPEAYSHQSGVRLTRTSKTHQAQNHEPVIVSKVAVNVMPTVTLRTNHGNRHTAEAPCDLVQYAVIVVAHLIVY